jgi:hypothetical protein
LLPSPRSRRWDKPGWCHHRPPPHHTHQQPPDTRCLQGPARSMDIPSTRRRMFRRGHTLLPLHGMLFLPLLDPRRHKRPRRIRIRILRPRRGSLCRTPRRKPQVRRPSADLRRSQRRPRDPHRCPDQHLRFARLRCRCRGARMGRILRSRTSHPLCTLRWLGTRWRHRRRRLPGWRRQLRGGGEEGAAWISPNYCTPVGSETKIERKSTFVFFIRTNRSKRCINANETSSALAPISR